MSHKGSVTGKQGDKTNFNPLLPGLARCRYASVPETDNGQEPVLIRARRLATYVRRVG